MKPFGGAIAALMVFALTASAAETGRIEGVVLDGAEPAQDVEVWVTPLNLPNEPSPFDRLTATTDAKGHFQIDGIPAMPVTVGRLVRFHVNVDGGFTQNATQSHTRIIRIQANQTHRVQIGGQGRPVQGKIVAADPDDGPFDFLTSSMRRVTRKLNPDTAEYVYDSADGKAFLLERTTIVADIDADGFFHVPDVPAGEWSLYIEVGKNDGVEFDPDYAYVSHTFTVQEMEGGRSDEPLHLGELPVSIREEN